MPHFALVSIQTRDHDGLVSAITGRLFDLGVALGDASFAVLGEGAEFSAILEAPEDVGLEDLRAALAQEPMLDGAELSVTRFLLRAAHPPTGQVTHRLELEGPDQPGLIARLTECLTDYDANIVRLNSERQPETAGEGIYRINLQVWLAPERADGCLAALANTALQLHLRYNWG